MNFETQKKQPESFYGQEILSQILNPEEIISAKRIIESATSFSNNREKQASYISKYTHDTLPLVIAENRSSSTAETIYKTKVPKYNRICNTILQYLYSDVELPEQTIVETKKPEIEYSQIKNYSIEELVGKDQLCSKIQKSLNYQYAIYMIESLKSSKVELTYETIDWFFINCNFITGIGYYHELGTFHWHNVIPTPININGLTNLDRNVIIAQSRAQNQIILENPNIFDAKQYNFEF